MSTATTDIPSKDALRGLIEPRRVVVVGASESPSNRGGQAIRFLQKFGFAGSIQPVHPSGEPVFGLPTLTGIADLEGGADVALVAVGAARVPGVITELGAAGVRAAIVWAGGFAEQGPEGAAIQEELVAAARAAGVRVLGPNCLGLVNTSIGFTGSFASWLRDTDVLTAGRISMVSQSGGLAAAAHTAAQAYGVGFRMMVSTGNAADISAIEMIEVLAEDPETHVLCSYLEGVDDGPRLLAALATARANGKSVVVLKGGRHAASSAAAAAHTGAMAGQGRIWSALLADVGAVQVASLEELIEVSTALATSTGKPAPVGRRIIITGYGGGSGVLATDLAIDAGLEVPLLSDAFQGAIAPLVPEIASLRNPIDLTPEAFNRDEYRERFGEFAARLDASDEIDGILFQGGSMARGADEAARIMCASVTDSAKQVVVLWPAAPAVAAQVFHAEGVRVFDDMPAAVRALARMIEAAAEPPARAAAVESDSTAVVPHRAFDPGDMIGEHEVHAMLRDAGVPTPDGGIASAADEAVAIAERVGFPVALKVVSEVTHRAAAGFVKLKLDSADAVRAAYDELIAGTVAQGVRELEGVYVQRMVLGDYSEFIVSVLSDATFGKVLSIGAGGVQTELLDDVTFARTPLTIEDARRAIDRLRIAGYLRSKGRGERLETLAAFLVSLSRFAASLTWEDFILELNPVMADERSAFAVDGLVVSSIFS